MGTDAPARRAREITPHRITGGSAPVDGPGRVPLWEWAVARDSHGGPVGVCRTLHGAMEALSKALIASGRPATGQVVPMRLSRPVHQEPGYVRGLPERTAIYDGRVIEWG